jgi:hypothetical protein
MALFQFFDSPDCHEKCADTGEDYASVQRGVTPDVHHAFVRSQNANRLSTEDQDHAYEKHSHDRAAAHRREATA